MLYLAHFTLDDVWDEDSAYIEMLANEACRHVPYFTILSNIYLFLQGARLREKSEKQAAGDDISETSDESDIDEELGYISPLDNVDPYVSFKQALTSTSYLHCGLQKSLKLLCVAFQMKDGHNYQRGTTSLAPEQQALLMEVMRIAEERSQSA